MKVSKVSYILFIALAMCIVSAMRAETIRLPVEYNEKQSQEENGNAAISAQNAWEAANTNCEVIAIHHQLLYVKARGRAFAQSMVTGIILTYRVKSAAKPPKVDGYKSLDK